MFETFYLPEWFNAPSQTKHLLAELWNKSYTELYDNDLFEFSNLTEGEFERNIYRMLNLLDNNTKSEIFYSRSIYFNWALCIASRPTIDAYCTTKYDTSKFDFILSKLERWSIYNFFDQDLLDCQIMIENYPGVIGEAVMIYQNMIEIAKRIEVLRLLFDSIDSCTIGAAICPGSQDKRAIFNWIIIEVFPAIYYERLPEFIYTYRFKLKPNWTYQKCEI